MSKRIFVFIWTILSCTAIYSQHPGSHGGNPFHWAIVGGISAGIMYLFSLIFRKDLRDDLPSLKETKDDIKSFTQKMGDKYGELLNLIKTFEPKYQIIKNTRQDLLLHLPNPHCDKPIVIHVYPIDPNLLISVSAVVNGNELFKLNSYDPKTDQKKLFNSIMSETPLKNFVGNNKEIAPDHVESSQTLAQNEPLPNKEASIVMPTSNYLELSQIQRYTLYFFADVFGGGLYFKEFPSEKAKEETQQILNKYQKELLLTDEDVNFITNEEFNIHLEELFENLRTIKSPLTINTFLCTCVSLIDINTNKTSVKDFFRMMSELGYQKEAAIEKIKSITFAGNTHFFDQEENDTVPKEKHEETNASSKSLVIINRWPLLDFAREHGPKMQVGEFKNKDNGEEFHACIFTKPDGIRTFVAFSSKLGEISPKEIASLKDQLEVIQLESGNYSLCKKEDNNWEYVDLGLE